MNSRTTWLNKFILTILTSFLISTSLLAGNYTWNGGTSTAWGTSTNWTPNGTPSTNDTVTIVTGSNNVYIAAKTEVKLLTMTSGTLNLQSNELSVGANSFFNGGTVTNGLLTLIGTNHTFAGSTISTKVSARCTRVFLNGSVFNDSLKIVIPSTGRVHASKGGNTFNGPVSITDSAIAGITLADSLPDIFNSTLDLYNASTANIFIAHKATGCQFNGTVSFNGPNIYSNYYGSATYTSNIILNNASGNFFFGYSTGSCTQTAGNKISIGGSGMSSGQLYLRNFTSLDSSSKITLNMTGTAKLYFESGSVFYDSISASVPSLYLNGSKFHGVTILESTGSSNVTSTGGCSFYNQMSFENDLSTSAIYSFANAQTDTFLMSSSFTNKGGTFTLNKGLFYGKCSIDNKAASVGEGFYISSTGTCTFKDSLYFIEINSPGVRFGSSGGITVLDSNSTFVTEISTGGILFMQNVTKLSTSTLTMEESPSELTLTSGNSFNGNFNFHGNSIVSTGTTFNSATTLKMHPTSNLTFGGGNTFNGTTIIQDSSSTAHNTYLANSTADDYNANVTFIQKGTSVNLYPAYTKNSTFSGNITTDGTSSMQFGGNGGTVVFDGTSAQSINRGTTSLYPTIKKLQVNKASNSLTINSPLIVSDSLQLTNGRINTDTTNLLSISHGGKLIGGSDSTYINGPLKKTGNAAFTFAVGSSSLAYPYHPLEITAPVSSTDSYTAQYFPTGQNFGSVSDTSVDNLNECQYWRLTRNSGVSKVKLKLSWNNDTCLLLSPQNVRVVSWDSIKWKDLGNSGYSGDSIKGYTASSDSIENSTYVTLALRKCLFFHSTISSKSVSCEGRSDGFGEVSLYRGTPPYSFSWEPIMGDKKYNDGLSPGKYYITTKDSKTCQLRDSITIEIPEQMEATFTIDSSDCGLKNGSISASLSGGEGPYNYFWPELGIRDSTASSIKSGKYSLVVTDSIGCTAGFSATLSDKNGPTGSITELLAISCYGQTSGELKFELGWSDTTISKFQWDRSISDTDSIISEIGAGMKGLQVMDANGCSSFFNYLLTEPKEIKINFNVTNSHCSLFDGSIVSLVTGGERPYVYSWSSLGSDSVEGDLRSGYDTLTVTDNNNCQAISIAEILDDDGPILAPHILSAANCFNDPNGSVAIAVTSATAPYNFTYFPDGENKDTLSGLSVGEYSVVVEDANGCLQKKTFVIPGYDPLDISLYTENASNDSVGDGKAFAFVLGGKTPYTYLWSDSSILDSISNLSLGDHSLIVTDQNGCIDTALFRINTTMYPVDEQFQCNNSPIPGSCPPITITCPSPCTSISIDMVADFDADPTGTSSSECAFESAAEFLQGLDPDVEKTIFIPFGTYIVGRQENGSGYYLKGNNVLCFDGINNLTIEGEIFYDDTTTLIFENCMKIGSFDYPNNPDDRLLMCVDAQECAYNGTDYSHIATMGQMIHLNECNNVTIRNLKLDGNLDNVIVGGAWPNGMPYDGIFLNACHIFTIENVITQNFGHDGIWINHRKSHFSASHQIAIPNFANVGGFINNVKSTNNCRTGLVWAGGSGLQVFNSEFSWNGMHRYTLQMAAGLDIEFENSNFANTNGYFYNCRFEYNNFYGMVNDAHAQVNEFTSAPNSSFNRDHIFRLCTFISASRPNSKAIHPNTKGMHFIDCDLYGWCANAYQNARFYLGTNGQLITFPDQSTSFTGCDFFEEYTDPIDNITRSFGWDVDETGTGCPVPWHHPLVEFSTGLGVRFIGSTITTNYTMKWILLSTDGQPIIVPRALWNVIDIGPSGASSIWRNFGLNACDPISCERNLGSINHTRLDNPLQIIGITGLNNASAACGGQDHYYLETLDLSIDDRNNRLWGDNITGNPSQVFPGLNVSPSVPKFEYIDPSPISVFSDCSNCTGSNDDCFACSTTEPSPACPPTPALRKGSSIKADVSNSNELSVSPNPVNSFLTIENEIPIQEIKIFDIFGSLVLSVMVNSSYVELQVSFLKPGTYFIDADNSLHKMFVKL